MYGPDCGPPWDVLASLSESSSLIPLFIQSVVTMFSLRAELYNSDCFINLKNSKSLTSHDVMMVTHKIYGDAVV